MVHDGQTEAMVDKRWTKAQIISDMIREVRLGRLSRCAQDCAETRRKISQLDRPATGDTDLNLMAQSEIEMRHKLWSDRRRMELNELLSRQTARKLLAQAEAQKAFGRSAALQKAQQKAAQKLPRRS